MPNETAALQRIVSAMSDILRKDMTQPELQIAKTLVIFDMARWKPSGEDFTLVAIPW